MTPLSHTFARRDLLSLPNVLDPVHDHGSPRVCVSGIHHDSVSASELER